MFIKIKVKSISELFELSSLLDRFHFRGQNSRFWKLQSSFERKLNTFNHFTDIEQMVINDFKVKAINYLTDYPYENDSFGWLTYIQQHGGYTPLLDFTKSLYIATFFSLDESEEEEEPVIWAIDGYHLNTIVAKELLSDQEYYPYILHNYDYSLNYDILLNDIINKKIHVSKPAICKIHPKKQFTRLGVQQGVFFTILNTSMSFHEQLAALMDIEDPEYLIDNKNIIKYNRNLDQDLINKLVIRITLPKNIDRSSLLNELWKMNINNEAMFPGLDGLARSVRYTIQLNENLNKRHT